MDRTGQEVGYVRVSSAEQNLDRQLSGEKLDKVFTEKASAKDAKRPQLRECIQYLRKGDRLHVHSIDRMARNLVDLQSIIQELKDKEVAILFHKEKLEFNGKDIADAAATLMLSMMGAFAEFERSLIKERQAEGIKAAQEKGVKFGREKALNAEQVKGVLALVAQGESKAKIASIYGVSRQTIYSTLRYAA
jgi:DNA invertase Pin-like site-specific DNA recombinase